MNALSSPRHPAPVVPLLVWWVIWCAILTGLTAIYIFLGRRSGGEGLAGGNAMDYVGLAPLALSALLRWLVLPRVNQAGAALPLFVVGLALAEGGGILGIFLGEKRPELYVLGVLGILQWAPIFAGRYAPPPGRDSDA